MIRLSLNIDFRACMLGHSAGLTPTHGQRRKVMAQLLAQKNALPMACDDRRHAVRDGLLCGVN